MCVCAPLHPSPHPPSHVSECPGQSDMWVTKRSPRQCHSVDLSLPHPLPRFQLGATQVHVHRLRLITVLRPPNDGAGVSHRDEYAGDGPFW